MSLIKHSPFLFSIIFGIFILVFCLEADGKEKLSVLKFDFGPKGQEVLDGFIGIDPETIYTSRLGYGFTNKRGKAVAGKIPDPLTNDSVQNAVFQVDLPNGLYELGIWTGYLQSGGNYAYFWSNPHIVKANNVFLIDLRVTPEIYKRDLFFKHSDLDVTPFIDIWKNFVYDCFPYKQATVEVTDGKLKLRNSGNAYLNGLVIWPSDKKASIKKELKTISAARRAAFSKKWLARKWKAATPPKATAEEKKLGYIMFLPDNMMNLVDLKTAPRPEQRSKEIRLFASRGEYEPMSVAVFPLKDAGKLSVSVSDLKASDGSILPADQVKVNLVRMYVTKGPEFTPRYMVPADNVILNKGLPRQFWFTLHVPEDAKPGFYRGNISFSSQHGTKRVPVLLKVLDLTLPDVTKKETGAPLFLMPYSIPKWYVWLRTPDIAKFGREKGIEYIKADLQFMRERGLAPSVTTFMVKLTDFYKLTREAGFTVPISDYGRAGALVRFNTNTNQPCPLEKRTGFEAGTPEFNKALKSYLDNLLSGWEKEGIPPDGILIDVADEVGVRLGAKGVKKLSKILKALHDYGKVRYAVFAGTRIELDLLPWCDWFIMTDYSMNFDQKLFDRIKDSNVNLGLYTLNKPRLSYGFYMWRVGAKLNWSWHHYVAGGAAYNTVGCTRMNFLTVPGVDGPLPTIFSETLREGVDDHRYILVLEELIRQAEKSKDKEVISALRSARKTRKEIWEFIDPNYKRLTGSGIWKPEVYNKLRWRIARAALKLQTVLRKKK
jgi:glycosyl hydrolase family 123/beta-agarase/YXIM esterase-like protein